MTILTPGQRRGIKGLYLEMPGEVKTLFVDLPCVFRPKPAADSDASRPPIPTERGH